MGSRRNTKSTKEETQKAQTNQGFSLCFLRWFCAFCVPKARQDYELDRYMNKLSTSIIVVLSLVALSQRHGASPPSPAQVETRRAIVGAYDSAHINGVVFIA